MTRKPFFSEGRYAGCRVRVVLVREREDYEPVMCRGPDEVYEFMKDLQHSDRERFYALHIDGRSCVVSCEEVGVGTATSALVHPREVYKAAILSSASGVILVHNHPTGDPSPSASDRAIAKRLGLAGELLNIPLVDSLVIGRDAYRSMREEGLIDAPKEKENND
jgi:DNA repair protein RadC